MTDKDRTEHTGEHKGAGETAAYIESLAGELARIAAADRLHMLHYLLEMVREEAATIARRSAPPGREAAANSPVR